MNGRFTKITKMIHLTRRGFMLTRKMSVDFIENQVAQDATFSFKMKGLLWVGS
jgi:hypothetical protein